MKNEKFCFFFSFDFLFGGRERKKEKDPWERVREEESSLGKGLGKGFIGECINSKTK